MNKSKRTFPIYGWAGLILTLMAWLLNWSLPGSRTHYLFFPLWFGYCLTVDGLTYFRKGTSPLTRNPKTYFSLFVLSAPVWWLFEGINQRLHNWQYIGTSQFSPLAFSLWATLNFTTVIPAVFGSAELVRSFAFIEHAPKAPRISPTRAVTGIFFLSGWILLGLMWKFPRLFFPFVWISIYFILEPMNIWLHNPNLAQFTEHRDWRPVLSLWIGVLICGFFWEMWNYYSNPKWIYTIPWGSWLKIFEMPILGYGGYLPFSLELYAMAHLIGGFFGRKKALIELQ
ncbi:MAG: hypothetical protein ACPL3P_03770 [Anaerolineales bacterium]